MFLNKGLGAQNEFDSTKGSIKNQMNDSVNVTMKEINIGQCEDSIRHDEPQNNVFPNRQNFIQPSLDIDIINENQSNLSFDEDELLTGDLTSPEMHRAKAELKINCLRSSDKTSQKNDSLPIQTQNKI